MTTKLPNDLTNLAGLAETVARNWVNNFPTYEVKFAVAADFLTAATAYKQLVLQNTQKDSTKKTNTESLATVNKEVETAVKALRAYIQGENPGVKDLDAVYGSYGLEPVSKAGTYGLIKDNDRRSQRIAILVQKLNETGNSFATRKFGKVYWTALAAQHTLAWAESRSLKAQKSSISNAVQLQSEEIREVLRKLQAQIKIDFPKAEINTKMRAFGFLNEIYR